MSRFGEMDGVADLPIHAFNENKYIRTYEGSKGGGTTTNQTVVEQQEIPKWIEGPATRNLQRAEAAQRIGYMPFRGLDVAGYNPTQQAAMQMNIDAANAFGMMPAGYQNLTATSGMPAPINVGGFTGYSSAPMYDLAIQQAEQADPTYMARYKALFS